MEWLTRFFYFSRKEVNGIKVLLGLMAIGLMFPAVLKMLKPEKMIIPDQARSEIKRFLEETERANLVLAKAYSEESAKEGRGITGAKGSGIGQGFRDQRKIPIIEINGADSLILQLLPGIGPAFASRIVRFRDRLGGFFEKEQLMEVYGLDSSRYLKLKDYVRVDTNLVRRIRINEVNAEDLGRHPLIGYKMGNLIVRYRDHHGPFSNEEELRKLGVLDEETIKKLRQYLVF